MSQMGQEEYASLLQEVHPKLWTLATAIVGDRTRAEDVVQDASITGLRKIADFQVGTNFTAWMSQIVRFTALNHLKASENRKTLNFNVHLEEDASSESSQSRQEVVTEAGQLVDDQQEFDDQVVAAMSQLEPERRACLLLRVVNGLSYEEIAAIVDVPEGTAMSHVHRAKVSMRRSLSK